MQNKFVRLVSERHDLQARVTELESSFLATEEQLDQAFIDADVYKVSMAPFPFLLRAGNTIAYHDTRDPCLPLCFNTRVDQVFCGQGAATAIPWTAAKLRASPGTRTDCHRAAS